MQTSKAVEGDRGAMQTSKAVEGDRGLIYSLLIDLLSPFYRIVTQVPLVRLLRYAKPYQSQVWGAILCSILRTLLDLAPPYLIGVAVDVVVEQEASLIARFGIQNPLTQLLALSLLTIATWA